MIGLRERWAALCPVAANGAAKGKGSEVTSEHDRNTGPDGPNQGNVSVGSGGPGNTHVLASEIQAKLGQKLQEAYADVIAEPVPDRFVQLLDELEAGGGDGASQRGANG